MSLTDIFVIMKSLKLNIYRHHEAVKIRKKIVCLPWKILNVGEKVNQITPSFLSLQASGRTARISLCCLLFFFSLVPLIKIVSLSALNELSLAAFVYPKLPFEMSTGNNVVSLGSCAGMEPAWALWSEAGSEVLPLLSGTVSLLAFALPIDVLYRLKWLNKRGRKCSVFHHREEFGLIHFLQNSAAHKWNVQNPILLKRQHKTQRVKHNATQENRKVGISKLNFKIHADIFE